MFDDLPSLFYHNVISAYDQYVAARDANTSGRSHLTHAALMAATTLFHFREHLPNQHTKTRAQIVVECPDYRLVADVVNATKHRTLDRNTSDGPPLVTSAEDIEEITTVVRYQDEQGEYTDARTLVFVNCSDGVRRGLDTALTNVLNFWGGELMRLNIVDYAPRSAAESPGIRFVPRIEACANGIEIVHGLRFKQNFQFMTFDPVKGYALPIDLTDTTLEGTIYSTRCSVHFSLNAPSLHEPIKCSIDLTEEQSFSVAALKTDAARRSFINTVLLERREEISKAISTTLKVRAKPISEGDN